ncbi:DctP family TRAP transporter solute-binding subunit [Rhodoferax saidenbachensis]|uniref:C4-dicarboxylate ABC transporter n=1 Tax=Rhodoferax saidenbachensis TaxID=1484693 RepID=A0A1P8K9B9_9BURK|nr:DctP family TRAP transporter solute-binding subunit [Rhodoferax saidenbachensis]APW42580.1 C4-dicarboxylate ABC transporter [Rhodoferax saidenbachensis]
MSRAFRLLFACWLYAALSPLHAATAAPVVVRFSHVVANDTPKGRMVLQFQALVAARSQGRIQVNIYPDSRLYGDDDEMEALRLGAVEMLAPSLSKFGNVGLPEFEVFDLPFLFSDLAQVHRLTQGAVGQQLLAALGRQQLQGLGFMDNGFKQMSARKPLRTPADYQGLRLRVQASSVLLAQMQALGAQGVALPFGESRRALSSRVVDGTENPLSNFLTQGLADVQSDVTLTRHGYLGYVVLTNPRFWASLAAADRRLLQTALADALAFGNALSATLDQQALTQLRSMPGVRIHALSEAERERLRTAAQPAYTYFERSVDKAFWAQIRKDLAAN